MRYSLGILLKYFVAQLVETSALQVAG